MVWVFPPCKAHKTRWRSNQHDAVTKFLRWFVCTSIFRGSKSENVIDLVASLFSLSLSLSLSLSQVLKKPFVFQEKTIRMGEPISFVEHWFMGLLCLRSSLVSTHAKSKNTVSGVAVPLFFFLFWITIQHFVCCTIGLFSFWFFVCSKFSSM